MIETKILDYLKEKLRVPAVMENITDTEYVLIEKVGSGRYDHLNTARFAIQSYAGSLYDAAALNEEVKIALLGDGINTYGIVEDDMICDCSLNSDYNFTDSTTKKYRYQAVYEFTHL